MAEEKILRSKGNISLVSKEDIESCDLWIHDRVVRKNRKKILLNYDFGKEGEYPNEVHIGRIKIPIFDFGLSTIGAIKYNNFEIIK